MYSAAFFFFLFLLLFAAINCNAAEAEMQDCHASCGPLANISYPFGLEQSPKPGCPGPRPGFNLTCKRDRAIFYFKERPYYVKNISYEGWSMWLIDSVLQRDNCSSLLSYGSSFLPGDILGEEFYLWGTYDRRVVYVNCLVPVKDPAYVPAAPCSLSSSPPYLYAILSNFSMSIRRLNTSCEVVMNIPASFADDETATTYSQIVSILLRGFQVGWRHQYSGCDSSNCHHEIHHAGFWKKLGRFLKGFWKKLGRFLKGFFKNLGKSLLGILINVSYFMFYSCIGIEWLPYCGCIVSLHLDVNQNLNQLQLCARANATLECMHRAYPNCS